jgi:hypothetical protein
VLCYTAEIRGGHCQQQAGAILSLRTHAPTYASPRCPGTSTSVLCQGGRPQQKRIERYLVISLKDIQCVLCTCLVSQWRALAGMAVREMMDAYSAKRCHDFQKYTQTRCAILIHPIIVETSAAAGGTAYCLLQNAVPDWGRCSLHRLCGAIGPPPRPVSCLMIHP